MLAVRIQATEIHASDGARTTPATGAADARNATTARSTDAHTREQPTAETPSRFSMLVTQFHVSPTHRCSSSASCAGVRSAPRYASAAALARRPVIVSQMNGNAMPGGVHAGRLTSAGVALPACASRFGRLLSRRLTTRDRSDRNANRTHTAGFGSARGSALSRPEAAAVRSPYCAAVATPYFRISRAAYGTAPPPPPRAAPSFTRMP
mmetsp:Transcript_32131/g.99253  ORF Transcript_32131/g.99253 Transcript_32131/m.99253 type:complete len:208 (+) Transcript_32131:189-812(+)